MEVQIGTNMIESTKRSPKFTDVDPRASNIVHIPLDRDSTKSVNI